MKKFVAILLTLIISIVVIIFGFEVYGKIEKDKKIEKELNEYKSNWSNGSIHICKLDEIRKKDKSSFIITDSNRSKHKDGIVKLNFKDKKLILSFPKYKSIVAKKIHDVYKKSAPSLLDGYNFYYFSPKEYGYENLRMVPQVGNLFILKNEMEEVKEYTCKKQ